MRNRFELIYESVDKRTYLIRPHLHTKLSDLFRAKLLPKLEMYNFQNLYSRGQGRFFVGHRPYTSVITLVTIFRYGRAIIIIRSLMCYLFVLVADMEEFKVSSCSRGRGAASVTAAVWSDAERPESARPSASWTSSRRARRTTPNTN